MAIGPFLFTRLLQPILALTAKTALTNSVRIVFVASVAIDLGPKGGLSLDNLEHPITGSMVDKYTFAKCGAYFHSVEFANRLKDEGILSVVWISAAGRYE
jgi:hypothetical protein